MVLGILRRLIDSLWLLARKYRETLGFVIVIMLLSAYAGIFYGEAYAIFEVILLLLFMLRLLV